MRAPGVLVQRWRNRWVRDAAVAVLLAIVLVYGAYGEAHPIQANDRLADGHPVPVTPTSALLLVAAAALAIGARRRAPRAVLAFSLACAVGFTLAGWVNGAILVAPVVGVYCLAAVSPTRRAIAWALVVLVVLTGTSMLANPFGTFGGGVTIIPVEVAAALFLGIAVANRHAYIAALQDRAEHDARQRVDAERVRIARELHDVVAHTMATINVQAGVAAHLAEAQPQAAATALTEIKAASKKGLVELRAILDVLHATDEPTDPNAGTAPVATLDQLDVLTAGMTRAGRPTTLTRHGDARPLPPAIELTAYRIVQESLTNALRYAGPGAHASVTLTYQPTLLRVEVCDDGHGRGPAPAGADAGGSGHGLAGMRQRAAAVGGTLSYGPPPEGAGGFLVCAELPLPPSPASARPATLQVPA